MKSKHTKGPWKTERKNCCTHIVSESQKGIHGWQSYITTLGDHLEYDGKPCGHIEGQDKTQAEINANVRLIAAAPEMLAALAEIQTLTKRTALPSDTRHGWEPIAVDRLAEIAKKARNAIAKAKGGKE